MRNEKSNELSINFIFDELPWLGEELLQQQVSSYRVTRMEEIIELVIRFPYFYYNSNPYNVTEVVSMHDKFGRKLSQKGKIVMKAEKIPDFDEWVRTQLGFWMKLVEPVVGVPEKYIRQYDEFQEREYPHLDSTSISQMLCGLGHCSNLVHYTTYLNPQSITDKGLVLYDLLIAKAPRSFTLHNWYKQVENRERNRVRQQLSS